MSWRRRRLGPSEVGSVRLVEKPRGLASLFPLCMLQIRFSDSQELSLEVVQSRAGKEIEWHIYLQLSANFLLSQTASTAM